MESKNHIGEYLAPEVGVTELSTQGVLCQSDFTVPNPFTGNDQEYLGW